jgi:DNA polymerase family A
VLNIKDFLFLDFETYYSQTFSLRKMTIPEYILDPQFEVNICACAVNSAPSVIVDGPDFGQWLGQFSPETTATVTFNALFDNSILAWCYGWVPVLMLDSMNMARALRGHILPKLDLASVCSGVLGVVHDKSVISKVINMRRADFYNGQNQELWGKYCDYANADNERSRDIFKLLLPEFPHSERKLMDLVIRAAVQPRFMLDKPHLEKHLAGVRAQKVKLLEACGANFPDPDLYGVPHPDAVKAEVKRIGLMSNVGFQTALENLGVKVVMKPGTNGLIPAFAKTDQFMKDLQEHWDPNIQALACARLGVKSTIEETRTERLIKIASLSWDRYRDGNPRLYSGGEIPVPLRYSGAHTHRLSGDWKLNMQNMPRGMPGKPPMLRKSLIAPPGHIVIAGDLAQIEARLVAWLAGAKDLLAEFAKIGGDPYSAFASLIFGIPIDRKKNKNHAVHGFIGKTGVLGLGYQCGDEKFYNMVLMLARILGIDLSTVVAWTPVLADRTVRTYRTRYWQIPQLWSRLQSATSAIWSNPQAANTRIDIGPVTITYAEIMGPNGLSMKYKNPRLDNGEYIYNYGWGTYKMYGGKMLENIIQFLARIIIMNAALRINDLGYRMVLQAHDELVFIVPISDEANAKALIYRELTRRPSWGKDIPLEAEVKSGPTYGDCK